MIIPRRDGVGSSAAPLLLESPKPTERAGDDVDDIAPEEASMPLRLIARRPHAVRDSIIAAPAMQKLYRVAAQVARGRLPVLIVGETGVGKEHLAQFVHDRSPRARYPFVTVNCASVTESLFESEFFGHERGAFTGAHGSKAGLLEQAGQGTVFLDEIGELPPSLQAKLLRAIESGSCRRVGGLVSRPVHARVVAATNRRLEDMVESGAFRRDLYHRIAGIRLEIPPLRERQVEILMLAELFIAQSCRDMGRTPLRLSTGAAEALLSAPWLGNIRELKNSIERSVLLAEGNVIERAHLYLDDRALIDPAPPQAPATPVPAATMRERAAGERMATNRRELVQATLIACGGSQTLAAQHIGISRRTLTRWLDQLDLPRPRKHSRPPPERE